MVNFPHELSPLVDNHLAMYYNEAVRIRKHIKVSLLEGIKMKLIIIVTYIGYLDIWDIVRSWTKLEIGSRVHRQKELDNNLIVVAGHGSELSESELRRTVASIIQEISNGVEAEVVYAASCILDIDWKCCTKCTFGAEFTHRDRHANHLYDKAVDLVRSPSSQGVEVIIEEIKKYSRKQ